MWRTLLAAHTFVSVRVMRSSASRIVSAFFATVATFGTAVEVTTSELSIELTFPADAATAEAMQKLVGRRAQ
jgi:hypothetical protein